LQPGCGAKLSFAGYIALCQSIGQSAFGRPSERDALVPWCPVKPAGGVSQHRGHMAITEIEV